MSVVASQRIGKLNSFYGKHHSEEIRAKLSVIAIEQYQAGIRDVSGEKNGMFGKQFSEEWKAEQSKRMIKYFEDHPEAAKLHASYSTLGKKYTIEERKHISEGLLQGREPKIPFNQHYYRTPEWWEWLKQVFERDNYTCQFCSIRSGNGKAIYLQPHHIKRIADYPELVFEVSNGITLCYDCHNLTKKKEKEYENYFMELLCLNEAKVLILA